MDALTPPFAPLLQRGAADGMEAGLFDSGARVAVFGGVYPVVRMPDCATVERGLPCSAECTLLRHRPGGGSTARRTNHMQC